MKKSANCVASGWAAGVASARMLARRTVLLALCFFLSGVGSLALEVVWTRELRLVFCNPRIRAALPNWESDARFVVAAFRAETARAGAASSRRSNSIWWW